MNSGMFQFIDLDLFLSDSKILQTYRVIKAKAPFGYLTCGCLTFGCLKNNVSIL